MDDDKLDLALWKLSVLGPLVSARLLHGDRRAWFLQTAQRLHRRPDGRLVKLSPRTIEAWYYAYRRGGLDALARHTRSDRHRTRAIAPKCPRRLRRKTRRRCARRSSAPNERNHAAPSAASSECSSALGSCAAES